MFALPINSSALVSPAADDIFKNIQGDIFRSDVSFLATARMLLYDRLGDEKAQIRHSKIFFSDIAEADLNSPRFFAQFTDNGGVDPNSVYVVQVITDGARETSAFEAKFKSVEEINGMKAEPAVNAFFRQLMTSYCFIDFENCRTLILTDRLTTAKWHAIASLTSRYFKKYFDGKPLTEWEKANVSSALVNEKSADKFVGAMREFAKRFDFRSAGIRASLAGFENRNAKARAERIEHQLEEKRRQIEEENRRYQNMLREKQTLEENKMALALGIKEDTNELMEYFLRNKNLFLDSVSDDSFTFYGRTPFANFDPDLAERMISNSERAERIDMYHTGPRDVSTEDRDLLFRAMMIDRTVRVWLYGKFTISMESGRAVEAYSSFEQPEEMADTCPNPHLYRHRCMGDNERAAIEAAMSGDYVLTVEQCLGAVASVNLAEYVTSGPWMEYLLSDDYGRFFELEDGTKMNFTEVMKYLKEKKESEE